MNKLWQKRFKLFLLSSEFREGDSGRFSPSLLDSTKGAMKGAMYAKFLKGAMYYLWGGGKRAPEKNSTFGQKVPKSA